MLDLGILGYILIGVTSLLVLFPFLIIVWFSLTQFFKTIVKFLPKKLFGKFQPSPERGEENSHISFDDVIKSLRGLNRRNATNESNITTLQNSFDRLEEITEDDRIEITKLFEIHTVAITNLSRDNKELKTKIEMVMSV